MYCFDCLKGSIRYEWIYNDIKTSTLNVAYTYFQTVRRDNPILETPSDTIYQREQQYGKNTNPGVSAPVAYKYNKNA